MGKCCASVYAVVRIPRRSFGAGPRRSLVWPFALSSLLIFVAIPVAGQSAADTVRVGHRHSPAAAGIIEFFLPSAGFAYAGDWTRGLPPNVVRLGAGIAFARTYDEATESCEGSGCRTWAFVFLASTIWSVVDAVRAAGAYNEQVDALVAALAVESHPAGGLSFGIRLRH